MCSIAVVDVDVDVDINVDVICSTDVMQQGCSSVVGKAISRLCCFEGAQTALTPGGEQHVAAGFRYGRPSFFTTHILTRKSNGYIISSARAGRRFEERNAPLGCENLLQRLHCRRASDLRCDAESQPSRFAVASLDTQAEGRQIAGDGLICSSYHTAGIEGWECTRTPGPASRPSPHASLSQTRVDCSLPPNASPRAGKSKER